MRNPKNLDDKQIRPYFCENYVVDEDEVESIEDHIHHFGDLDYEIYLTEEEHSMFAQEDDNNDFEEAWEQYQRGYLHAIDDVQRKIKLKNLYVIVNKGRFNQNQPSSSQQNTEKKNERQKYPIVYKEYENKIEKTKEVKQPTQMDVKKIVSTFNLQIELSKEKITIPFNELLRNREYRDGVTDMVRSQREFQPDIL